MQEFEALAGAATAERPDWLEPIRRAAMERFAQTGFPGARDEEWRFTPVAPIAQGNWRLASGAPAEVTREQIAPFAFGHADWTTLVFVNGTLNESLSDVGALSAWCAWSAVSPKRCAATGRCSSSTSRVTRPSKAARSPPSTPPFFAMAAWSMCPPASTSPCPVHLVFVTTAGGGRHRHPSAQSDRRGAGCAGVGHRELRDAWPQGTTYWTNPVTEVVGRGRVLDRAHSDPAGERAGLSRRPDPRRPAARQPLPLVLAGHGRARSRGTTCTSGSMTRTSRP